MTGEGAVPLRGPLPPSAAVPGRVYLADAPVAAHLEVGDGAGGEVAELLWTERCVAASPCRAVVLLDGPAPEAVGQAFELVHRVAEEVAGELAARTGAEVGAIEVAVLRPADGSAAGFAGTGPVAVLECAHAGGVEVRLRLEDVMAPALIPGQE